MSAHRTPEWLVERLRAGDLDPAEAEAVRARLEAEGGLARLDALRRDDATFLEAHPPGPAVAEIRRRAPARPPRRRRLALLVPLTTAAVAAAAVLFVALPARRPPEDAGLDERTKGLSAHLQLHRQRSDAAPERLADGALARAGDLVQLSYVSAGAPFGAVVSVDGGGAVTLHWPEGGGPAAPLLDGHAVPLPHAYRLDDAPAYERFFFVTSYAPFDSAAVVEAARRLAASGRPERDPLPVPAALAQRALLLRKTP